MRATMKSTLEERFPNVEFKLRQEIITIKWLDGPTTDEVREVVGPGYFLSRQQTTVHGGARAGGFRQPSHKGTKKSIYIGLPDNTVKELDERLGGDSRSFLIRQLIEEYIKDNPNPIYV